MPPEGRKPPNAGKGRKAGVPNKATRDVRAAIAKFAEGNVEKLQEWLDRIAAKDPAKAAELFVRVLEYHIPKLARTEINGDAPLAVPVVRIEFVKATGNP